MNSTAEALHGAKIFKAKALKVRVKDLKVMELENKIIELNAEIETILVIFWCIIGVVLVAGVASSIIVNTVGCM